MIIKSAEFAGGVASAVQLPDDLPEIPVVGRSNVGKSSLLNYLTGRKKLVSTSRTPGKTREVNFFLVNKSFYLVDIPGFGYAKLSRREQKALSDRIEMYFNKSEKIAGVIYLVDIRRHGSRVDREALEWLGQFDIPLLVVATKADKLKKGQISTSLKNIASSYGLPEPPLMTSTLKKTGRDEVLEQIAGLLGDE